MSVKVYCDLCGEELKNMEFMFEATVTEAKVMLNSQNLNETQKRIDRKLINACRDCYYKHINKLLCK